MKICEMNLPEILGRFEVAMLDEKQEVADSVLEFELFDIDDHSVYALQFNKEEKKFYITKVKLCEHGDEYPKEIILSKYPIEYYNREFVMSRIVKMMEQKIFGSMIDEFEKNK